MVEFRFPRGEVTIQRKLYIWKRKKRVKDLGYFKGLSDGKRYSSRVFRP
jgi:hypothetical protein